MPLPKPILSYDHLVREENVFESVVCKTVAMR